MAGETYHVYRIREFTRFTKPVIEFLYLLFIKKIFYGNTKGKIISENKEWSFLQYKGEDSGLQHLFQRALSQTFVSHYLLLLGLWQMAGLSSGSRLFDQGFNLSRETGRLSFFKLKIPVQGFYTFLFRLNPF